MSKGEKLPATEREEALDAYVESLRRESFTPFPPATDKQLGHDAVLLSGVHVQDDESAHAPHHRHEQQ